MGSPEGEARLNKLGRIVAIQLKAFDEPASVYNQPSIRVVCKRCSSPAQLRFCDLLLDVQRSVNVTYPLQRHASPLGVQLHLEKIMISHVSVCGCEAQSVTGELLDGTRRTGSTCV